MKIPSTFNNIQKKINQVMKENNLYQEEPKRDVNEIKAILKAAF